MDAGVPGLLKNFKLGVVGVEVSWRGRRQGSALHPPKDPFLKGPLDSPKIFIAGVWGGVFISLLTDIDWAGRLLIR